jgi:hypothetical protein
MTDATKEKELLSEKKIEEKGREEGCFVGRAEKGSGNCLARPRGREKPSPKLIYFSLEGSTNFVAGPTVRGLRG